MGGVETGGWGEGKKEQSKKVVVSRIDINRKPFPKKEKKKQGGGQGFVRLKSRPRANSMSISPEGGSSSLSNRT